MHPIVAQLKPSPEQEPAITARGCDIVVTAGAGAGKTRTLVARYLDLLAEGPGVSPCHPEATHEGSHLRSIVAITFTRKAAREMRNRVREAIRRYLEADGLEADGLERDDLASTERELWQRHYSDLDAARIGTIHNLCIEILRHHPAEARLDPLFVVLDEGQLGLLQTRAIEEALAWAAADTDAARLFALLGEHGLRSTLEALLSKRLVATAALDAMPADLWAHWQKVLADAEPTLELNDLDRQAAEVMPALRAAFTVARQRLESYKRERNALDFDDLVDRALRLLTEHESVRAYWHSTISAILVDEFQDTNQQQRDLIALLNAGGRLFIVGDAKQSIYRFQGADVAVFRGERKHIERTGGTHFGLPTSYRAHRELVLGLNDLLRPVLGEGEDPLRPWAEPFQELKPYRERAGDGFCAPHIELHLALGSKSEGALDNAARALVVRLRELVEGKDKCTVAEGPAFRPLTYGDVAILCRASISFAAYENALNEAGLPYLTVAGRGFYERPEVRDLLNALLALADPTDDLALVGLLRSPVLGWSDPALYRLVRARGYDTATPLWELLKTRTAFRSGPGAPVERTVNLLNDLLARVGRAPVADVLKAFLDRTDYRAALLWTGDRRGARNVDKLLAYAHQSGIVGAGEFLEYVEGLKGTEAREGEARATVEGAVQIMTVHQAKGLEFPVVVIGDATHRVNRRDDPLFHPDLGLTLPLKDEDKTVAASYALARQLDEDMESAEDDRLLYVAATRAREKLLVSGCFKPLKSGKVGSLAGWLGRICCQEVLGLEGRSVTGQDRLDFDLSVRDTPVSCTIYAPARLTELAATRVSPATGQTPIGGRPASAGLAASEVSPSAGAPATARPTDLPLTAEPGATPAALPPLLQPVSAVEESVDERTAQRESIPAQRVWRVVPAARRPEVPAWVLGSLVHEALAVWRFPAAADVSPGPDDEAFARWAEARARSYGLADRDQLTDAVRQSARLLQRFHAHDLFKEMNTADLLLHEVPYHMENEGHIESGIIDALYRRGDQWTLVEFKTDELRKEEELPRLLGTDPAPLRFGGGQGAPDGRPANLARDYLAQSRTYVRAIERLLGSSPRAVICFLNVAGAVRLYEPTRL